MPFVLGLILCLHCVSALNFDTATVIEVELPNNDIAERSYFGYSLLLQKGRDPRNSRVIVGSPKQNEKTGGALFGCKIYYLGSHGCTKYNISDNNEGTFNGNFFGASLDGGENIDDPLVVCAFRKMVATYINNKLNFWQKGHCFYQSNSSVINPKTEDIEPLNKEFETAFYRPTGTSYYLYGFGQAGFDVFYNKDIGGLYLGAPGTANWQGTVVMHPLLLTRPLIARRVLQGHEQYEYLGYKITYGTFNGKNYVIAGAPRGSGLRGRVVLFQASSLTLERSIEGEEFGSYFGASVLAVNIRNNESDVLFVGAPMAKNKKSSFEEGCVYYYKDVSKSTFITLLGSKDKPGARFGSNIVSLGDIDLDTYNDIAISAPFEDDGVGAVYIFQGPINEKNPTFSQRLSPSTFSGNFRNVKGFGMGLSRGVDVDGNGFNDLAVGAYRSGQAFVIKTKPIIDFQTMLSANVSSVSNNSYITIMYCIRFTPRAQNTTLALNSVNFQTRLKLDFRVVGRDSYDQNIQSKPLKNDCRIVNVTVKQLSSNISPFKYSLSTQVLDERVFAQGKSLIERTIPYAHGCGSDNICQTAVLLHVSAPSDTIILGQNRSVTLNVTAENFGEPGYECQLYIEAPEEVAVKLDRRCVFENSTYICLFANQLLNYSWLAVPFDIVSKDVSFRIINIDFDLKCPGEKSSANASIRLNVLLHNSVYVAGKSEPESVEYFDQDTNVEAYKIIHTYTVGNFGPSPAKTGIYFLLPQIKIGTEELFPFADVTNSETGNKVNCRSMNYMDIPSDLRDKVPKYNLKAPLNRTTIVHCHEEYDCLAMFCEGDILYKSSQTEKFSLKFSINPELLGVYFKNKTEEKNILAYFSSAIIYNGTVIDSHIPVLILSSHTKSVPLWVYIVGAFIGLFLLCLLIFLLFKCKFFEREYKKKLNDEKLVLGKPVTSTSTEKIVDDDEEEEAEEEEAKEEAEEERVEIEKK